MSAKGGRPPLTVKNHWLGFSIHPYAPPTPKIHPKLGGRASLIFDSKGSIKKKSASPLDKPPLYFIHFGTFFYKKFPVEMESLTSCREHFNQSQGSKYQVFTRTGLDSTLNFAVSFDSLLRCKWTRYKEVQEWALKGVVWGSPVNREHWRRHRANSEMYFVPRTLTCSVSFC